MQPDDTPWPQPIRFTEVEFAILRHIRRNPGRSRTEIAAALDISKAMMTKAMDRFNELNLVLEDRRERNAGRGQPPVRVTLNADAYCSVGVSLHLGEIAIVTMDLGGTVRDVRCRPLAGDPVALLEQHLDDIGAALAASTSPVLGVGMAIPARVDESGSIFEVTPSQRSLPLGRLAEAIRARFAVPVYWDNSPYCVANYEAHRPEVDTRCLFYVGFDFGVGAGLVSKDEVFRGANNQAANFGALVPESGPRPYLPDLARHLGCTVDVLTLDALDQMAQSGDAALFGWIDERAGRLSLPLSTVVQLFNPDQIVLGGFLPNSVLDRMIERIDLGALDLVNRRPMAHPAVRSTSLVGIRGYAEAATLLPISARLLGQRTISPRT